MQRYYVMGWTQSIRETGHAYFGQCTSQHVVRWFRNANGTIFLRWN